MTKFYTVGDILPNGAKILRMGQMDRSGFRFVLATWEKNGGPEYVSWSMDSEGHCEQGYYGTDFGKAVARYNERCGRWPNAK
jgi:hypothetical protein